jgi:hypothetical protein
MNPVLLAIEALEEGCTAQQAITRAGLSPASIDALDNALCGESWGHDLWREVTAADIQLAERQLDQPKADEVRRR